VPTNFWVNFNTYSLSMAGGSASCLAVAATTYWEYYKYRCTIGSYMWAIICGKLLDEVTQGGSDEQLAQLSDLPAASATPRQPIALAGFQLIHNTGGFHQYRR
jgi:hypothetical protein